MKTHYKFLPLLIVILIIIAPLISALNPISPSIRENQQITTNTKIQQIITLINETIIETYLNELVSIGPRMTGTYGCEKAGGYLFNTLQKMGLDTEAQYWKGYGNRWYPGPYNGYNIEATLHPRNPTNDEIIIFNAHYDTVRDTVGANDDGSGVVGVLAAAYALSHFTFDKTIRFVTFSGEEIGLLGSTAYATTCYDNNDNILVELNADMIGKAETTDDGNSIRLSYSEDTTWILDGINHLGNTYDDIGLTVTGTYPYDRDRKSGGSDYFPFIQHGYESIAFWEAASDPNMHTPKDDLSNVNISYLVKTSRLIAATIAYTADQTIRPITLEIETPQKGACYYNDRIITSYNDITTRVFDNIWVYLNINTFDAPLEKIEFYLDNTLLDTIYDIPYAWNLNTRSIRNHKLTVIAYDTKGRTATDQVNMFYWNIRLHNQ